MNIDLELIEQLVIKEFYGIITAEEKVQLEDATDRYPEAWRRQQEIQKKLQSDEFKNYLKEHTDREQFLKLTQRIHQNQRRRNAWKISASVATVVVLFFFAIWYVVLRDVPRSNTERIASNESLKDTVIFEFSNGLKVPLGSGIQRLDTSDVIINTNNEVLTYQSNTPGNRDLAFITVPAGKSYRVYLSDSTEVEMNAASKISFPIQFHGDTRKITIEGEAFVKVKPRSEPFIVQLPKSKVQVLGTAFNVNTYDNVEKISLVSGGVRVSSDDSSFTLKPDWEVVIADRSMRTQGFDTKKVLGWREGEYYIENLTIREISKMLFRIYGINVVIDNDQVAQQHFTGRIIRNKPIETFLNGIKAANFVDYSYDTEGVIHIK